MKKFLNTLLVMLILTIVSACSSGSLLDQYEDAKERSNNIVGFLSEYCNECKITQDGDAVLDEENEELPTLTVNYKLQDDSRFSINYFVFDDYQEMYSMVFEDFDSSESLQDVFIWTTFIDDFGIDTNDEEITDKIAYVLVYGGITEVGNSMITNTNNEVTIYVWDFEQ